VLGQSSPWTRIRASGGLLDPSARELYPEWEDLAQEVADVLTLNSTRFSEDPSLIELIEELVRDSADFGRFWRREQVFEKTSGRKVLDHPVAGRLELEYESLEIAPPSGQVLIVYTAEPGSPTAGRIGALEDVAAALDREQS
jgi:hypothetical protein